MRLSVSCLSQFLFHVPEVPGTSGDRTLAGPWCGWGRAAHFTLFLRLKPDTNFSSEDPPSANLQLEARVRLSDLLFPLLCAFSDRAQKTFEILENGAGEVEASAGAERRSKDAPSSPRKSPHSAADFLIAISGVEVGEARNTLAATDRTSKVAWNLRVVPEGWSQRGDPRVCGVREGVAEQAMLQSRDWILVASSLG